LDESCRTGGCKLEGAATITSGITADTTGILMGPGQSSATIAFARGLATNGYTWHIEILASGAGSFTASEPPCEANASVWMEPLHPTSDYQWLPLHLECAGLGQTDTATVSVNGTDGSILHIADVRIVNTHVEYGCSG
jgi:hypothetical protein